MTEITLCKRTPEERNAWMEGYEAGRSLRVDTLQVLIDEAYNKGFKAGYNKRAHEEIIYTDTDSLKIKEEDKDA